VKGEICRPNELGAAELELWHTYQRADPHFASPFLTPEFALAVDVARSDARIIVVSDGPQVVGFLPYTVGPGRIGQPIAPGMCDAQALIHVETDPVGLQDVITSAGLIGWRFDHLVASQAPSGQPWIGCDSWIADLRPGLSSYLEWLHLERGRNLSEWQRKLRRVRRSHEFVQLLFDVPDIDRWQTLIRLKRQQYVKNGWQDVFAKKWVIALLETLESTRTPDLTGTVSSLVADGRVVSVEFGLLSRDAYSVWFSAYEPEYAADSPGALLTYHIIESCGERGIGYVDFGKGLNEQKRRFSNGTEALAEGFVGGHGPMGRAASQLFGQALAARQRAPRIEAKARAAVQAVRRRRYRRETSERVPALHERGL
jgi:CelD/BcsL family acetyltransferase involved in cellulose biosynthesis